MILGLVLLSASAGAFALGPENMKEWSDPSDRAQFLSSLKERGVPHRVDADGRVWYPAAKVRIVDQISREVLAKSSFLGVNFPDSRDQAAFRMRLEKESIPFGVRTYLGQEWITWTAKFDKRAREIRDMIEDESMERARQERATK
jgi:hypothetical protein